MSSRSLRYLCLNRPVTSLGLQTSPLALKYLLHSGYSDGFLIDKRYQWVYVLSVSVLTAIGKMQKFPITDFRRTLMCAKDVFIIKHVRIYAIHFLPHDF